MVVSVFDNRDGMGDLSYQQWRRDHPQGWVLNSRRFIDPGYMVLHRARCHSISRPAGNTHADPFTGRGYVKVCADDVEALRSWIASNGGANFSNCCSRCRT